MKFSSLVTVAVMATAAAAFLLGPGGFFSCLLDLSTIKSLFRRHEHGLIKRHRIAAQHDIDNLNGIEGLMKREADPQKVKVDKREADPQKVKVDKRDPEPQKVKVDRRGPEPQKVKVDRREPEPQKVKVDKREAEPQKVKVDRRDPEPQKVKVD